MNMSPAIQVQVKQSVELGSTGKQVPNMFYNKDFEDKINNVQDEFDRLLAERQNKSKSPTKRPAGSPVKNSAKAHDFAN